MNQAEAIEKISKALSNLTSQIAQENFAGFYSKNRLLEDLLLPVFAIIFNAPDLRNLNIYGQNQPFLDLGDDQRRIAIQVTTEHKTTKIRLSAILFIRPSWLYPFAALIPRRNFYNERLFSPTPTLGG